MSLAARIALVVIALIPLGILGLNCQSVKVDNSTGVLPAEPDVNRFAADIISSPRDGYIDSIFVNSSGDRIYFLHSPIAVNDFMNGTNIYPMGTTLPDHTTGAGLDWNSDLYYVEWNGSSWSAPVNLGGAPDGSQINSLGNECCMWLNESETEIIFYRDNFDLPALGPRGNFRATRSSRSDPWGTPTLLSGSYGSTDQSSARYRHDIHKGSITGDLYLWEKDPTYVNLSRLLYGFWNGTDWDAPVAINGTDSSDEETQIWVSADERTMLFNRRAPDGNTKLMRMTRSSTSAAWGNLAQVTTLNFVDSAGMTIWGEPTLPKTENYMLFIRFDTSQTPWKASIMHSAGTPTNGFATPTELN